MYKNFNLTDKERQQILESHKSHGYKQPLKEQPTMSSKLGLSGYDNANDEIKGILLDRHDGPVTDFVVISRAIQLSSKERRGYNQYNFTADDIANALHEVLESLKESGGELSSNEFRHLEVSENTHLGEQNDSDNETPNLDKLVVEDHIYVPIKSFTVYVLYKDGSDDVPEEVPVVVSRNENGEPVFNLDPVYLPDGGNSEDYINAVKQKMGENPFNELKYTGSVLNYETGETENY
jgi:hypothetical protein